MSARQPARQSNHHHNSRPPVLAEGILSFFLPSTLRDPILGDLQEEFSQRMRVSSRTMAAHRWYWRQALQSACLFLWQQRGAVMAYLISVVFFLIAMGLAIFTADFGFWLISPPVLILTVPASILLGIGATSAHSAKMAVRLSFSDSGDHPQQDAGMACRFLRVTGNQFLLVAGVAFFLGVSLLLIRFSQEPELLNDPARYLRYAMALLPLFYGLIFKCLFYSAEQKLQWKYA